MNLPLPSHQRFKTKLYETISFIYRCFIRTDMNPESLLIRVEDYFDEEEIIDSDDEDEEVAAH